MPFLSRSFGGDVLCIDTLGRAPLDALTDPADANAFDFLRRAAQEAAAAHPRTRVTTDVGGGPSIAATAGTRTVSLGPEIGAGPARTPASRSVACRTDREREESRGPADRSLEKLILGLGLGGSIPSPPPPPPPPVVAEAPMRGQGDPQAWPMMLKFGRNTNPAAHAVPTPQHTAAAAAETQTAASVAEAEEEEVGAAELGEAVEALRMEELQRAVQRREGSGAAAMATAPSGSVLSTLGGEIHVFQNARNYIRLELSTSESMSFGVGHEGAGSVGAAGEEPAAAHRASAGVGQDSAEDAVAGGVGAGDAGLGVDFAYDVVSESGTVAVSKLGAGAGSEVGARGVTIRLGADGKLSEADYARVRAAARN